MTLKYLVLTALLIPILAWSQESDDLIEAARLGMVEKMYERMAGIYRKQLEGRGLSDEKIENILFEAIDEFALCTVLAARAQAHEQGLSEVIILKGFGRRTRGKRESLHLLALDTDALKRRTAPCKEAFDEKLDVNAG